MAKLKSSLYLSTISYNTEDFLRERLMLLAQRNIINFWIYIKHLPEDDEKKVHYHVFLDPNGPVELKGLREWFDEFDLENPSTPLRCMPIWEVHRKNFGDWWLYNLHDPAYLLYKNESRKYHYTPDDMITTDPLAVEQLVRSIDFSTYTHNSDIYAAIKDGASVSDLVERGLIRMDQFYRYSASYYAVRNETYRGGRSGHDPS